MCRIAVIPSVNETSAEDLVGKTAVVIDVLRATSTIITALQYGCEGVIPVETVYQAKERQLEGTYLGGERNGKKIPGFDLGNSPFEYMSPELRGKKVILTTTNGTRAIQKSSKASCVVAAALLNVRAAARYCLSLKRDIAVICAERRIVFLWKMVSVRDCSSQKWRSRARKEWMWMILERRCAAAISM